MRQFEGKVVLITGGTSGIGKATAEAFAREGAKVVIAARREELGREIEAVIRASGGEATFIACDVSSEEQVRSLVQRTVQTYGRLDHAYNNAAAKPLLGELAELSTEAYDETFNVTLRGLFLCMKYEIQAMLAGGGGAIVNCSTIATITPHPRFGAYAAAKGGVEILTRTAALEYAHKGIRINSVCPGPFDTPMEKNVKKDLKAGEFEMVLSRIALRRLGRPAELAHAVLFLCSEGAAFIIGANLVVDGGFS